MSRQRPIHISIPKPCTQSWAAMQTADGGRFCAHCQHTVVDYAAMSDAAVVRHIATHGLGCGRFRQDQLEREIVGAPLAKGGWRKWLVAGLSAVFSFGARVAQGTERIPKAFYTAQPDSKDTLLYDELPKKSVVRGTVKDDKGEILISASITAVDSMGKVIAGTVSNFDGIYEILIPAGYKIISILFSYQGNRINYTDVNASPDAPTLLNPVMPTRSEIFKVGGPMVYRRKKIFWQRFEFGNRR